MTFFIGSFVQGVINVLSTTPLWVANTRIKLQGVNLKTEEMSKTTQYKYNGLLGKWIISGEH